MAYRQVYVVEYAKDSWGQMDNWVELDAFNDLEQAKEQAMTLCLAGNGVRMYVRDIKEFDDD